MIVRSILEDNRIHAFNALVELTIGEYLGFAKNVIDDNDFQRKRVIKSKIKEILTADLLRGCVIPSIVLAISNKEVGTIKSAEDFDIATKIINESISKNDLVIIDGLQRTYVMKALEEDLIRKKDEDTLQTLYAQKIRAEVYLGLSRTGLLYRMITLNTGQTTMSTRHLMEILYLDYSRVPFEGISLIKDKDDTRVEENTTTFNFKTILDGFNSYIEKDESVIERVDILDNIKSLEVINQQEEAQQNQQDKDLFKTFLITYKTFLDIIVEKSNNWKYNSADAPAEYKINSSPFGKSVLDIFKKSQAITGFGAALGFMNDKDGLTLDKVQERFVQIEPGGDWNTTFLEILKDFDKIKERSKKIGNDQRFFFKYLFRGLLRPSSDHELNMSDAANYAYRTLADEKGYKD
ncbi:hypothetical protein [Pedobacter nyackensis]|uniref:DGQHR domain-containing protein n=1 Tax=Pedobacter nyackensis TaxID=475255 RepID=A0A1W2AIR6_9SPHI|nr:hypothetical protein [Pedobacter nyackensis]SMC60450.1 hypothetical protein SAMN04488101_101645 [Pedobacter nyackensis]